MIPLLLFFHRLPISYRGSTCGMPAYGRLQATSPPANSPYLIPHFWPTPFLLSAGYTKVRMTTHGGYWKKWREQKGISVVANQSKVMRSTWLTTLLALPTADWTYSEPASPNPSRATIPLGFYIMYERKVTEYDQNYVKRYGEVLDSSVPGICVLLGVICSHQLSHLP